LSRSPGKEMARVIICFKAMSAFENEVQGFIFHSPSSPLFKIGAIRSSSGPRTSSSAKRFVPNSDMYTATDLMLSPIQTNKQKMFSINDLTD
jgi:hypothetical protein